MIVLQLATQESESWLEGFTPPHRLERIPIQQDAGESCHQPELGRDHLDLIVSHVEHFQLHVNVRGHNEVVDQRANLQSC